MVAGFSETTQRGCPPWNDSEKRRLKSARSMDPSVYLRRDSKIPMLWVNGTNDFAYPMDSWLRSVRLHQPSKLCLRIRMPHGHGVAGENPEEIHVFMNSILKGGKPLAEVVEGLGEGSRKMVRFRSEVPMVKAELCFTRDTGKWQDRKWESIPAELNAVCSDRARRFARRRHGLVFQSVDERDCVITNRFMSLEIDRWHAPSLRRTCFNVIHHALRKASERATPKSNDVEARKSCSKLKTKKPRAKD